FTCRTAAAVSTAVLDPQETSALVRAKGNLPFRRRPSCVRSVGRHRRQRPRSRAYQCRDPKGRCYSTLIPAFRIIGIHLPSSCSTYFTKSLGGMVTASAPSLLNFSAISGSFRICATVL